MREYNLVVLSHQICGNLSWLPQETNTYPEYGLRYFHLQTYKRRFCLPLGLSSLITTSPQPGNPRCLEYRSKFLDCKTQEVSGWQSGPSKGSVIRSTWVNMHGREIFADMNVRILTRPMHRPINLRTSARLQLGWFTPPLTSSEGAV